MLSRALLQGGLPSMNHRNKTANHLIEALGAIRLRAAASIRDSADPRRRRYRRRCFLFSLRDTEDQSKRAILNGREIFATALENLRQRQAPQGALKRGAD